MPSYLPHVLVIWPIVVFFGFLIKRAVSGDEDYRFLLIAYSGVLSIVVGLIFLTQ